MASEPPHGEAEMTCTPSAAADVSGVEAAASSVDEKNPVSSSSGQQETHVSDAKQQNGDDNDDDTAMAAKTAQARAANGNLCGVCEISPSKYKCSRCRLPYCSVSCSKAHQQNHPTNPPKEASKPATETPNAPPPPAPIDASNPFSALATSDKLQLLFKKYPNLPNQLLAIHDATQPPPDSSAAAKAAKAIPASLMKGLPANSNNFGGGGGQWNHDIGIKNGKAALRRARGAGGEDGEAIREYTELILHIMNETNDRVDAAAYVQRQVAEQDTALIERLLAEDRRNQ